MTADSSTDDGGDELPADAVEQAERLTRRARDAVDDAEADAYRERREALLDEYSFAARLRADDGGETLVLYPAEWIIDGRVRVERVDDTERAVEVPLDGPGDAEDWAALEAHNREIADQVAREHGDVHGANAHAFADFMSNHYARRVETAGESERAEFLDEYFPRNAWPTDEQRAAVEASLDLLLAAARQRD